MFLEGNFLWVFTLKKVLARVLKKGFLRGGVPEKVPRMPPRRVRRLRRVPQWMFPARESPRAPCTEHKDSASDVFHLVGGDNVSIANASDGHHGLSGQFSRSAS